MRNSLKHLCDLQVENEAVLRRAARLDFEEVSKLAALIISSKGAVAEEGRIRDCRALLKKKAGIFSNWRGIMNSVVLAKMSLADDPSAYFDGVQQVYEMLTKKTFFTSEFQCMCAMTIYDLCPTDRLEDVCTQVREQYKVIRDAHPLLTDHSDLSLIALMILAGIDPDDILSRAEECLELVKPLFALHGDTKQMIANILALSDKPVREKVDAFWAFNEALTAAKHKLSKSRIIAILAAFTDVEASRDQLVTEICETDAYLKGNKGYGALGVGKQFRWLMSAVMVLLDHEADIANGQAIATGTAIVEVIAEQIVETIIMIIVITSINASHSSSSN